MPLTFYQRQKNIKDIVFGTSDESMYLALSSTPIQPDGTGLTEPEGNGYARKYIEGFFPNNPTYDQASDKYSYENNGDMYFDEATGPWGTLGYFAIINRYIVGGQVREIIYAYGTLASPISPVAGQIPVIRPGDLVVSEQ